MKIKLKKKCDIGYFTIEDDSRIIGGVHYFFSFPDRKSRIKVTLDYEVSLSDFNEINQYLQSYDFNKSILEDFNTK